MEFHHNDRVGIIGDWESVFTIVGLPRTEPACQIQRGDDLSSREWVLTDDLELISSREISDSK
jgi:hypothetical protein